jgi:hypothetical protein
MEVPLYTRAGEFVVTVKILPYKLMPEAILWGARYFIKRDDGKYYEGFVHMVVE